MRKTLEQIIIEAKICKALVDKQIQNNFTRKELAQELKISPYRLNRFLSGEMNTRMNFLKKVMPPLGLKLTIS